MDVSPAGQLLEKVAHFSRANHLPHRLEEREDDLELKQCEHRAQDVRLQGAPKEISLLVLVSCSSWRHPQGCSTGSSGQQIIHQVLLKGAPRAGRSRLLDSS